MKEIKEEIQSNPTLWQLHNQSYPLKQGKPIQNPAAIQLSSIINEWGLKIGIEESLIPPV